MSGLVQIIIHSEDTIITANRCNNCATCVGRFRAYATQNTLSIWGQKEACVRPISADANVFVRVRHFTESLIASLYLNDWLINPNVDSRICTVSKSHTASIKSINIAEAPVKPRQPNQSAHWSAFWKRFCASGIVLMASNLWFWISINKNVELNNFRLTQPMDVFWNAEGSKKQQPCRW